MPETHPLSFYQEPVFWVLVAFILFWGFLGRPLWRQLRFFLDNYSHQIKDKINSAATELKATKDNLASSKLSQAEAYQQAKGILEHAELESIRMHKEAEEKIEKLLHHQTRLVEERILQAEKEAIGEIRAQTLYVASRAAEKILKQSLDRALDEKIINQAIKEIEKVEMDKIA